MNFETQTIEMMASKRSTPTIVETLSIQATTGIGTGLAYHHANNDPMQGYVLTHIASGGRIGAGMDDDVDTEEEARRWLELCAPLADWKSDLKTLALTLNRAAVKEGVHQACEQAKREHLEKMRNIIIEYPCRLKMTQAEVDQLASEAAYYDCDIDAFILKLVRAYLNDEVKLAEKEPAP
jgi:hypothetical protein